jgi:hypothetical protein
MCSRDLAQDESGRGVADPGLEIRFEPDRRRDFIRISPAQFRLKVSPTLGRSTGQIARGPMRAIGSITPVLAEVDSLAGEVLLRFAQLRFAMSSEVSGSKKDGQAAYKKATEDHRID